MYRLIKNLFKNQFKIGGEIYSYHIGETGVLIKSPDGQSKVVKKEVIKGHYDPKGFKKTLSEGTGWKLKSKEIKKYVEDKLWSK